MHFSVPPEAHYMIVNGFLRIRYKSSRKIRIRAKQNAWNRGG
jgi:hypothetical protein